MQVDFTLLMPEFMLAGLGVLVLTADFAVPWASRGMKNGALAALTVLGLAVTFAVMLRMQWGLDEPGILYDHLIYVDRYALLFKALAMAIGAVVVAHLHGVRAHPHPPRGRVLRASCSQCWGRASWRGPRSC